MASLFIGESEKTCTSAGPLLVPVRSAVKLDCGSSVANGKNDADARGP